MEKKRIYLNAFEINAPGHHSPGLWAHPEDNSHQYKNSEYWKELARTLERGMFDGIFIADVLGVSDVYQGSRDASIRQGIHVPINDPTMIVPIMAEVTEHLGFGVTVSTTHEHPYILARRMTTLDHLTNGRIGWNIVTSYLKSAAANIGLDKPIKHSERYDIAAEYLEVCLKLWESSWEDDAVRVDKENRVYTDPSKVHDINHEGVYFKVPGAHLSEPSPQRTPVLYQAGASQKGMEFAAKYAECIFIGAPTLEVGKNLVNKIRNEVKKAGRSPEEVKIMTVFTPIVGRTEKEAIEKHNDLKKYASYEGSLALLGGLTGIDFSNYDLSEGLRLTNQDAAITSTIETFNMIDPDKKWTLDDIAEFMGVGGLSPLTVGDPEQIADIMEQWVDEAGVDGFNFIRTTSPGTIKDIVDLVVPVLQERGRVRTQYDGNTYRGNLFGRDQLPEHHPGKQFTFVQK